jgi:hypothetical protein
MKGTANPSLQNAVNAWMDDPVQVDIVRQMKDDLAWAMEHHDELELQYPGESVVVWRKQVIAHGTDDEEKLLRAATSAQRPREQLVVVEFPNFFESPR